MLPTRMLDGAAEVWEGRIRLWDADLWVQEVELPPTPGTFTRLDAKGRHWPADERLLFRPAAWVYTLRTHRGHVKWAVLDWQAETALPMLGVPPASARSPR